MPQDSNHSSSGAEALMDLVTSSGQVSFHQLVEFARRPHIDFGIGVDVFDVILADRDLGKVSVDFDAKTVRAR